jgi:hypothetical protein
VGAIGDVASTAALARDLTIRAPDGNLIVFGQAIQASSAAT